MGLEALLSSESPGQQRQCNKRNRSKLEPCRRGIICPSLKEPLDITGVMDVGPRCLLDLVIRAVCF